MPVDPRFLPIERWSALTASLLEPYGNVPRQTDEDNWPSWATAIKSLPALAPRFVPDSIGFTTWQSWAYRLNEALRDLGL